MLTNQLSIALEDASSTDQLAVLLAYSLCQQSLFGNNTNAAEASVNKLFSGQQNLPESIDFKAIQEKLTTNLSSINQSLKAQINLRGELGAGKTSLARAFLKVCGVTGRIKSPSYALVETYIVSNLYLYHFDFYRFSDAHEWRDAGFDELLAQDAISLIEWPEQAAETLPVPDLDIHLEYAGNGRNATLSAHSTKGQQWLQKLHNLIS